MIKQANLDLHNSPMKVGQLTFTRFVAAILVVAFHHYKTNNLFSNANVFVSYFYLLSGFVLMLSQKQRYTTKREYNTFYVNRIARIFPVYLLALFSFVALEGVINWDILLHILGVQSFFPKTVLHYNYPGWSISVELFFYFCFPFLASWFYSRYSLKTVLVTVLGFWALCQALFAFMHFQLEQHPSDSLHNFLYYNPINHLNEFMLGSAAAIVVKNQYEKWKGNYDLPVLIFTAFTVLYLSFDKASWNLFDHNGLLAVLFLPIIVLLSLNTGLITKLFNNRLLVILGEISFGVYILAEPVLGAFNRVNAAYSIKHFPFSIMMLSLVLVCYLVYISFEKPLQQLIKKSFSQRKDQRIETKEESVPVPVTLQPGVELTRAASKPGETHIELS